MVADREREREREKAQRKREAGGEEWRRREKAGSERSKTAGGWAGFGYRDDRRQEGLKCEAKRTGGLFTISYDCHDMTLRRGSL